MSKGYGAHVVRLIFEIVVIIDDPGAATIARWNTACRCTASRGCHRGRVERLVLEILPHSVALDGKPGKGEYACHGHTKTDDEAGKGTWVPCAICS